MFEQGNADWLSELTSVVKKYNISIHLTIKMTPIQASKNQKKKKSFQISKTIEKLTNQTLI